MNTLCVPPTEARIHLVPGPHDVYAVLATRLVASLRTSAPQKIHVVNSDAPPHQLLNRLLNEFAELGLPDSEIEAVTPLSSDGAIEFEQGAETMAHLQDCWVDSPVVVGDSVNLIAEVYAHEGTRHAVLDSNAGLLILHPDVLLSGDS